MDSEREKRLASIRNSETKGRIRQRMGGHIMTKHRDWGNGIYLFFIAMGLGIIGWWVVVLTTHT